jgi:hypothetical protein
MQPENRVVSIKLKTVSFCGLAAALLLLQSGLLRQELGACSVMQLVIVQLQLVMLPLQLFTAASNTVNAAGVMLLQLVCVSSSKVLAV